MTNKPSQNKIVAIFLGFSAWMFVSYLVIDTLNKVNIDVYTVTTVLIISLVSGAIWTWMIKRFITSRSK
jgi:uncharacterized membrane protein (UPF0182 family)